MYPSGLQNYIGRTHLWIHSTKKTIRGGKKCEERPSVIWCGVGREGDAAAAGNVGKCLQCVLRSAKCCLIYYTRRTPCSTRTNSIEREEQWTGQILIKTREEWQCITHTHTHTQLSQQRFRYGKGVRFLSALMHSPPLGDAAETKNTLGGKGR
jgi:hypothetical protein